MRKSLFLIPILLLTACSHAKKPANGFITGKATVLDINQTLGICTLQVDGKPVPAYWDTEADIPQDGAITRAGPFGTPVGTYKEPYVRHQKLPANPGDTILFRAIQTNNELYLRAVQVVQN